MTALTVASFAVPMTQAEETELEGITADLRFIYEEFELPPKMQIMLARASYNSVMTLSVMGDDKASVRTIIASDFIDPNENGLNPAVAKDARAVVTKLLSAWMTASTRATDDLKLSAEAEMNLSSVAA